MFGFNLFTSEEKFRFEFKIKIHDLDQVEPSLNEMKLLNKEIVYCIQIKKSGGVDEKEVTASTLKCPYKKGRISWEEEIIIKTNLFKDRKKQFFEPKKIQFIFEFFDIELQKKHPLSTSDINLSDYANLQDEKISFSVPFKINKNIPMLNLTLICKKIPDEMTQEPPLKRNSSFFTLTMPKKEEEIGSPPSFSPKKRSQSFFGLNIISPRKINTPIDEKREVTTPRILVEEDDLAKEKKLNENLRKEIEALKKTETLKDILYSDLESKYVQLVEKLEILPILQSKIKSLTLENENLKMEIENYKK